MTEQSGIADGAWRRKKNRQSSAKYTLATFLPDPRLLLDQSALMMCLNEAKTRAQPQ